MLYIYIIISLQIDVRQAILFLVNKNNHSPINNKLGGTLDVLMHAQYQVSAPTIMAKFSFPIFFGHIYMHRWIDMICIASPCLPILLYE